MLVSVIFIFNVFVFGYSAETYDCRNGTVYLKLNEIAFFQTQNYPNFLSKLEQKRCDLMFASANGTNKVIRMVMAFYQFPVSFSQFPTFFSLSNDSLYDIRYDFPPIGKPIAEQGFFAFTDEVERCPLEFICKDKPFKILYENQILHIRSSYAINAIRQNPCQWKFVAPDGYGFKIVVQKFNISTTTLFKIENMTEIIANERSIRTNYAYYNSDSFIQIDLSKGDLNFIPEMEFQAYISIVKHSQEKSNTSCTISYNEDSIVWTNIKKTKGGYENNVQCFYELIIPPKSVVYVSAYYYVEKYIEYVKYYEVESNNSKIIDYDSEPNFIIDNYNESADKHVMFEFISDGNVQSYGFSINFEFIVCECSNIVAECYDNYYLMDIQSSIDEAYYCGNLECNIIIGKCSTSLTHIQFSTNTYVSTNDIFKIISNNRTVFEIIDWKNDNHIAYINSSAENIFLAITHRSSKINTLIISVSVFDAPQESKLILSDDNMTAIIDTALNPFTTIEMESKNQFFILYCPIPESIALYEDTSLTTPIKYCFIGDHPNKCIIKKNSFVIYSDLEAEKTYLTIRLSQSASNCVFGETTYFTNGVTSFPVSALSKKNESCIITILADDYYFITNLWTTSKNKNVKVFAGIDQTKLYFEFNYKTQKTWQHISMSSEVYTILIPPSAGFFIILEKSQSYSQSIIIADSQYKSLVPSLDFGCTKRLTFWLGGSFVYYSITVYPVIFTVLENTLTLPERFYFQINNGTHYKKIYVNKRGEYFVFHNQNISIIYIPSYFSPPPPESGVLLLMQAYSESIHGKIF